jgi:hypothetical protein
LKTIREWLGDLPEPHRAKALKNLDTIPDSWPDKYVENMELALIEAFCWECSPEGDGYWEAVYQNLDE